jgi:hypothetical protein
MKNEDTDNEETFSHLCQVGFSPEEVDKILDELVELSRLISEHCRSMVIDSRGLTECVELIVFLTE